MIRNGQVDNKSSVVVEDVMSSFIFYLFSFMPGPKRKKVQAQKPFVDKPKHLPLFSFYPFCFLCINLELLKQITK